MEPSGGIDREELRTRIALFRHGLVAGLESAHLEHGELMVELRKIARRKHGIPGSRRTKVSVKTLRRWLVTLRRGGLEALKPKLRGDYGVCRAVPEEWLQKAVVLRQEVPSRSASTLVEILKRLPECPAINVHTLDKALRRLGMTRKQLPKPKERKRRWRARHVNDLWQGDASDGVWLADPRTPDRKIQTTLFLWIDDVSRLVPHAEFFFDEKLPRLERTLKLALLKRGVPNRTYSDNGKVYRATQFDAAQKEMGINPIHSRAYRPEGRGKIERIFRTIQEELYPEIYAAQKAGRMQTLQEVNEALWAWLDCVYHNRVHREIKQPPLQAYREGLTLIVSADPVKVARAFLWRFKRKVSANGFLSLKGNTYSVDPAWAGRSIELRCDPFDLSRIEVYQECRPIAVAHARILKTSFLLEIHPLRALPPAQPSGVSFLDLLRSEHRRQQAAEIGVLSFRDALTLPNDNKEAHP